MNPEVLICEMDSSVNFEIEIFIEKGRGYVSAEENENDEASIGTILPDSILLQSEMSSIILIIIELDKKQIMKSLISA